MKQKKIIFSLLLLSLSNSLFAETFYNLKSIEDLVF
jgi:hypothetical protein